MNDDSHITTSAETPGGVAWALFGHAAFQYLNAGCELGLFEYLNHMGEANCSQVTNGLALSSHPTRCLLFALNAMKLIERNGDYYRNGQEIHGQFQDGTWPLFVDIVRFEAQFAYVAEQDLVESLRKDTNVGLRRFSGSGPDLYHRFGSSPDLQQIFFRYMSAWTALGVGQMLKRLDFSRVRSAVDVGGGDGTAAVALARAYPHIRINLIELPEQAELAQSNIISAGVSDRVRVVASDFFTSAFPNSVDCFFFIHQLVIWPLEVVTKLLIRAHNSLRPGGLVVILNSMAEDSLDGPLIAALDTAYFLSLPSRGGMIHPWADYEQSLTTAGFENLKRISLRLWTPQGVITAEKPLI
jgi:SAM-dependent methyltransferase